MTVPETARVKLTCAYALLTQAVSKIPGVVRKKK